MAAYEYVGRAWNVSAQTAGEALEAIEKRDGEITPQAVVDDARPEDSALHRCFDWDDESAAEKYRLHQAKNLIRCIVVVPEKPIKSEAPVRMFINRNSTEGQSKPGSFINYKTAFESVESRMVILANARRELKMFRDKYSQLKELAEVFKAIDKTLREEQ